MDYGTIRIPVDMNAPIEAVQREGLANRLPLHVDEIDCDNPDEFNVAFYTDNEWNAEWDVEENARATMVALAIGGGKPAPTLRGDILLVCPEELATLITKNDAEFQVDALVIRAFREWLEMYATSHSVDKADVFYAVLKYLEHVRNESMQAAQDKEVNRLAGLLGVSPDQIGVIVL